MEALNYMVSIDKPFIKVAFESFVKSLGIRARKVKPVQSEPQPDADISALFGTWKNLKVDAKELRQKAWKRENTW